MGMKDFINKIKDDIDNGKFHGTFLAVYTNEFNKKPKHEDMQIYGASENPNGSVIEIFRKSANGYCDKLMKAELEEIKRNL